MFIAEILQHKGNQVVHVAPTVPISEVVRVLGDKGIGAVLVLDNADQLVGIVSERDIMRCLMHEGARTLEMSAGQLMTRNLTTAEPGTSVNEAMRLMTAGRFRHVPVLDQGRLVGLISIGDVVKARSSEQEQE
ncbi:MAG: CBS domain-containing protein, partial [Pseudomonadota bacterium]|nr:CBS domain-containing protein [Pseudomonadota bacterium]